MWDVFVFPQLFDYADSTGDTGGNRPLRKHARGRIIRAPETVKWRPWFLLCSLVCGLCIAQDQPESSTLWQRFEHLAPDARPMMRWWWFGPAVTDAELDREITAMKASGFGGFEVQPVYALTTDDPSNGIA
ncbi:MAG: hypothetical protein ACJ8MH_05710, partial [Povalibacter sp.]